MRILLDLHARADAHYEQSYHHKLRGRLWRALEGTTYESYHGSREPTFSFSNPFPWGDIEEGDTLHVQVASPHDQLLAELAADFLDNREFNIGEMPFDVTDVRPVYPDVGTPGTSGVLETATGVCVRMSREQCDALDISRPDTDTNTYWQPEHTTGVLEDLITTNLQSKHDALIPGHLPGPADRDTPLFDGMELIKTYNLHVTVTQGETRKITLSKWRLPYTVRDAHHRRHLNLALDCGIGHRNAMGLGFLNITDGPC